MANNYISALASGGGTTEVTKLIVTCSGGFAGTTITCTDGLTVLTGTCPSTSPYTVEFELPSNGTWTVSGVVDGSTISTSVTIPINSELIFVPNGSTVTPVNDIQTWLHCADIWDKSYTTIAQVLADSTTLLALISSNNAVDYMARSTSWASSVTANSTAMTYIGNNDYCANKLLSNSTWLNAICNSTYFESVLNVKVPTMTSDTTPRGVASASTIYAAGFEAFRAFDGIENPNLNGWYGTANVTSGWIQYQFVNAIKLNKVRYVQRITDQYNNLNRIKTGAILGSNDGTNFTSLYTINDSNVPSSQSVVTHIMNITTAYKYIRLRIDTLQYTGNQAEPIIGELQFYGRA